MTKFIELTTKDNKFVSIRVDHISRVYPYESGAVIVIYKDDNSIVVIDSYERVMTKIKEVNNVK